MRSVELNSCEKTPKPHQSKPKKKTPKPDGWNDDPTEVSRNIARGTEILHHQCKVR